jgi:hypothetical protein
MVNRLGLVALICLGVSVPYLCAATEPVLTNRRAPSPGATTLKEIREAELRKIPLEVFIKAPAKRKAGEPVEVTVMVTNLFKAPLLMNSRLLVNHPRLAGEVAFRITDESGKFIQIEALVTPLSIREDDFVILGKGESIHRTVDLADVYGLTHKGTYKVQVFYHNEVDFVAENKRAWKGHVWSEPVQIELD